MTELHAETVIAFRFVDKCLESSHRHMIKSSSQRHEYRTHATTFQPPTPSLIPQLPELQFLTNNIQILSKIEHDYPDD